LVALFRQEKLFFFTAGFALHSGLKSSPNPSELWGDGTGITDN